MTIKSLDHINIFTQELSETVRFYEEVLGLKNGDRPAFDFNGAWLYCGDKAIIHLVEGEPSGPGTGVVDHFALGAENIADVVRRAREERFEYEVRDVPGGKIRQVFLNDPNGVKVELNFFNPADVKAELGELLPA